MNLVTQFLVTFSDYGWLVYLCARLSVAFQMPEISAGARLCGLESGEVHLGLCRDLSRELLERHVCQVFTPTEAEMAEKDPEELPS